jgi:hypothetical protein
MSIPDGLMSLATSRYPSSIYLEIVAVGNSVVLMMAFAYTSINIMSE